MDYKLQEVLSTFLNTNIIEIDGVVTNEYLEDLMYFTTYVTPETQYRDSPEICFNVAEYITWLFLDRIEPYPLNYLNPYMSTLYPDTSSAVGWDSLPIEINGVYKVYFTSNKEQHEFVMVIVRDKVHILSGYRNWYEPIYATFNKFEWINRIFSYISLYDSLYPDKLQYNVNDMLTEYSDLFGLPITITSKIYRSRSPMNMNVPIVPRLDKDIWYVRIL